MLFRRLSRRTQSHAASRLDRRGGAGGTTAATATQINSGRERVTVGIGEMPKLAMPRHIKTAHGRQLQRQGVGASIFGQLSPGCDSASQTGTTDDILRSSTPPTPRRLASSSYFCAARNLPVRDLWLPRPTSAIDPRPPRSTKRLPRWHLQRAAGEAGRYVRAAGVRQYGGDDVDDHGVGEVGGV